MGMMGNGTEPDSIEWRDVVGFPNYEVNNRGDVRSKPRLKVRKSRLGKEYTSLIAEKILSRSYIKGYPVVSVYKNGQMFQRRNHTLVLEAFVGPCPEGMEARHLNGNRDDARLENLSWGTQLENTADRKLHGRNLTGTKNPSAKMDEARVRELRNMAYIFKQTELAGMFGIDQTTVSLIINGKIWRHVIN